MSGGLDTFALREEDVMKFLACQTHIGTVNCDYQMQQYVYDRRPDDEFYLLLTKWIFQCWLLFIEELFKQKLWKILHSQNHKMNIFIFSLTVN